MPRVPSADYSPIEAANSARANARKIGNYAADAANWKARHERNLQSMDLQSKSLDLQQNSIDLNKWTNGVNTLLNVVNQGVSFGQQIYNWTLNNAQNEVNAYLQTSNNRLKEALLLHGDKIEVRKTEDGSFEVIKPQSLIDLENEIKSGLEQIRIPDEMKAAVQASFSSMLSDNELEYFQNAIYKEQAAQEELFTHNLDQAIKTDIANGFTSPETAFDLIDQNTDLTDAEKELKRAEVALSFTNNLAQNNVQIIAREQGIEDAYTYINNLPSQQFDETQKTTLRGIAENAVTGAQQEAINLASAYWTDVKDGKQVVNLSTLTAAYENIDVLYSNENGYSPEFREAYRTAMQTAQKAWADDTISKTISQGLQNSSTPWTVLQTTAKALANPDSQLYSWYYGLDADRQSMLATVNAQLNEYTAIYGDLLESNFSKDANDLARKYVNNEITADELWTGIESLYTTYTSEGITSLSDFDMHAYWEDLTDDIFSASGVSKDTIVSNTNKALQAALEIENIKDLTPEQQRNYIVAEMNVYSQITDWLNHNLGNFSSQEYAEEVNRILAGYNASYLDYTGSDVETSTAFNEDYEKSAKYFTEGLENGLISVNQESVTPEGYVTLDYKDGSVRTKANEAFDTIKEYMNNTVDGGLAESAPQIRLGDEGQVILEYKGKNGGIYTFDTSSASTQETLTPAALREDPPTDELETITSVNSEQGMQLGVIDSRLGIIRSEVETEMSQSTEGDPEYRIDGNGNILLYFRLHDGSFVSYDETTGKILPVDYLDNPKLLKLK